MTTPAAPKGVAVLGSTGSIGTTALRVLDRQRERFRVTALTANSNAGGYAVTAAVSGAKRVAFALVNEPRA